MVKASSHVPSPPNGTRNKLASGAAECKSLDLLTETMKSKNFFLGQKWLETSSFLFSELTY